MIKIVNTIVIESRKFVELILTTYIDMNDNIKSWEWIRRKNNTKAVVICATYNNALIITKEYRIPLNDYEFGFAAGLIDKNETIEDAARRELKEETGLDIDNILHISPFIYNSAGLTNESISIVICTAKGTINQYLNEGSEDITTYLMTKNEVIELLKDTTKKIGAKAYLLMYNFVNN